MKLIVEYFFLADIFISGGIILGLNKYIFPWQMCLFLVGHLRLELSCISVTMLCPLFFCPTLVYIKNAFSFLY